MELSEREKKKLYEAAKAEMIKQAHGISIADKMIKISGERIKLELDGRILDRYALGQPEFQSNRTLRGRNTSPYRHQGRRHRS